MEEEAKQESINKTGFPWMWVILLVVIIVIAGGAYLFLNKNGATNNAGQEKQNTNTQAQPTTAVATTSKKINIEGNEFAFSPSTFSVNKGDTVELSFKNTGKYPHDISIIGLGVATKVIQPGEQDAVSFVADKTGSFEFKCTVGTHAEKGMVGTLIVK